MQRFGVADADLYAVMRALTYFGDAEHDPVFPAGLTARHWDEIKRFFVDQAPLLLAEDAG